MNSNRLLGVPCAHERMAPTRTTGAMRRPHTWQACRTTTKRLAKAWWQSLQVRVWMHGSGADLQAAAQAAPPSCRTLPCPPMSPASRHPLRTAAAAGRQLPGLRLHVGVRDVSMCRAHQD